MPSNMDRMAILEAAVRKNDAMMNTAVRFLQAAVGTPISLATLDRDTLVCVISELGLRYKAADAERLELKRLIPDAQSSRNQLADTIKKLRELEDAHMIQSKFIHQLQKKTSKIQKYIETIEIQEKVIMKMQKVIESSAPKRARNSQDRNRSESDSNNGKIIFDVEDENTPLPETQNQVDELKKYIRQLTEKIDYKNSKIEENLCIIEEKGLLLNRKNDENNVLQEKNSDLMEKYQKLQNENSKVTTNREKPSLREEKLLMITAEMELKVKQLSEDKDSMDMKLKVAIDIIENMKNRNEEEARIREKGMETDRYLLKESREIAEEEREKLEIAQREIRTMIQIDANGSTNRNRKEDFDKETLSKDSCILELASQLASLKAHDEIFKMEKIELENKLNLRISELEKEFIIDNMKNANVKLDKTDFDSMRNVFFNDQNENDNEEVKKLKKYIQYEEKKHNDHISELITLLSIETKQKDEYKAQLQEYENIRNMISNTPKEKDSFGCTNVTDITERSIPIESPSESSDQLTSFVKKEELEKLLLCSTSDFEEMKKNLLGLYSNNNSIPKTSRSTDFSARTEDTEISYSNSSFQMTAIVKINELEKQLFNSENAKSMLQDEIDEIIKKNYTASSVLENRAEEENLRNKINELEVAKSNKISELTSKFTIMENEFKNKIVNIDKEKTAKFDVLKNQLNQFSSSDEILKNQIAELEFSKEKKIGELEIELKTSKTKIETMKEEMSDMKSENVKLNSIKNTKIAGLEIEILELEKDEKKYLQEINDLKTHQASCTEEFEIKEQKMIQEFSEIDKRKNSKIKEIEAEVVTLKIQINFCTNKIKDLETAATETLPSSEVRSPMEYQRHIDKVEAELAAKDFRISALEAQLVNSAQESSREMAKLRTELFEMQIQGLGGMSDDIDGNTSSTYGNQFSSPRDYVPSIQIQSNNMDSDLSTPDSGKHAARRRTSLQPNVMSGTPVSGVSVVRPPSGNAVKAANALRNSNTDLIELKASSTAGNLV